MNLTRHASLDASSALYESRTVDSGSTPEAWSNKGAALAQSGQFEEALECYDRAIELKPDDAGAWNNKGIALYSLERYEEAKSALEQATRLGSPQARQLLKRLGNQSLGVNVRGTALTPEQKEKLEEKNRQEKLAGKYEAGSNFAEALRCRREALRIVTELYGQDDWRVTDARLDLEDLNKRSRMSSEKRESLEESQRLNDQSNELWREEPEEALPIAQKAMVIRGEILGKENRDYVESLTNVAMLHKILGDFARAKELYTEALTVREKILGKNHPDYVDSLKKLAGIYSRLEEHDKAHALFEEASKITIPPDHP